MYFQNLTGFAPSSYLVTLPTCQVSSANSPTLRVLPKPDRSRAELVSCHAADLSGFQRELTDNARTSKT